MNEQILRICELCMKLNSTKTLKSRTNNKPTVFFSFSGHVCLFTIDFHLEGWPGLADLRYDIYTDGSSVLCYEPSVDNYEPSTSSIDEIIKRLEFLVEKWCDNV